MRTIGRLVDEGEPAPKVADMNIAGNHLQFRQKLAEAANDLWPHCFKRTPSRVFTDAVVSGV